MLSQRKVRIMVWTIKSLTRLCSYDSIFLTHKMYPPGSRSNSGRGNRRANMVSQSDVSPLTQDLSMLTQANYESQAPGPAQYPAGGLSQGNFTQAGYSQPEFYANQVSNSGVQQILLYCVIHTELLSLINPMQSTIPSTSFFAAVDSPI